MLKVLIPTIPPHTQGLSLWMRPCGMRVMSRQCRHKTHCSPEALARPVGGWDCGSSSWDCWGVLDANAILL
jgi:hypothetical protein